MAEEDIIARFCFNCGKEVPEKAKFCPFCGEDLSVAHSVPGETKENLPPSTEPKPQAKPSVSGYQETVNKNFTLLEPGKDFRGYKILRMMNKDAEGIKYIAEKDGKEYVLKVFYKSSFSNMNSLFGLQMRLSRIDKLKDDRIARVVEVNQSHSPAYMAVEYVHGVSLAEIKKYNPERLDEKLIRRIIPQLIQTAMQIRKHGLTIEKLTLAGIMLSDREVPIILSSAVSYEESDERDDVFVLAVLAAQLLSKSGLYKSIYSENRLKEYKFTYINGVSMDLNKVLAECLHRNINQRFASLQGMYDALMGLPGLEGAELCSIQEQGQVEDSGASSDIGAPKMRIELGFWMLVIMVVALIAMLFTTNIYTVLFGAKGDKFQYTGWVFGMSEEGDSLDVAVAAIPPRQNSPTQTQYGELKAEVGTDRIDPRRIINTPAQNADVPSTPLVQAPKPGANFIYIKPGILALGQLGNNKANSVSITGFYISKHEVTQAEWNKYMKPAPVSNLGDKLPVDNVSWFDVAIYCNGRSEDEGLTPAYKIRGIGASRVVTINWNANGYRLPTEAEWEMAAKAGEAYNYSGNNDATSVAWYRENSAGKLRIPGSKAANGWGLYDMSGNVSEWVWDWYDANYLKSLPSFLNPTGPETGIRKTIRGGNVMDGEGRALSIINREYGDPNKAYPFVGFRLVRSK